jgi:hypothetical protein
MFWKGFFVESCHCERSEAIRWTKARVFNASSQSEQIASLRSQ